MTKPREAASLQEIARRLAEVFVAASSLIGRSEEETRLREEETARVAVQAALGVLPRPAAEDEEARPRSGKARRRARRARRPEAAQDGLEDGVVQLDPNRRRTAR